MQITATAAHHSTYDYGTRENTDHPDQPMFVEFRADFDTIDDARKFAASFPKSHKWHSNTVSAVAPHSEYATASTRINLTANGTTGAVNESGIKRYHRIVKAIEKAGHEITWKAHGASNYYRTRGQFEDVIAAQIA